MTSDLLEENQDLRKQVAELEKVCNKNMELADEIDKLEKENAELKEFINAPHTKGRKTTRGDYIKTVWELSKKLAEAKEIIKTCLGFMQTFGYSPSMDKFVTEAEHFLNEDSTYEHIQKAKFNYVN